MTNLCQKVALAGAATFAVAATVIMAESASAQSVTICQSLNFETTRCSINTRGGIVLERVLSQASCIRRRDWDYSRGFVWVRNGCRAQFRSIGGDWIDRDRRDFYSPPREIYHPPRQRQRPRRRIRRRRKVIYCP
jgi:hypothetical protein